VAEYRRWIARIYSYEKGIKKSLSGFAWLETYDGELRLKVEVKVPGIHEKMVPVYFFKRHKNGLQGVRLGELNIQSGNGKFYFVTPCQNISRSGLHFLEMNGIILYMDALHYFGSQWDEKPITQKGVLTLERKMPKEEGQIWFEEVITSMKDRLQDGEDIVRAASVETSMKRGMNVESNLVNSRRISVSEQSMTVEEARKRHEARVAARQKKSNAAIELTTEGDKGEAQKRQESKQREQKELLERQRKEAALAEEKRKKEEEQKEEARQKEAARQLEIQKLKEAERQQEEARQREKQRLLKEEEKRQEEKKAWEEAKLAAEAAKKQEEAYAAEQRAEEEKAAKEKRAAQKVIEEEKKAAEEKRAKEEREKEEQRAKEEREKEIEEKAKAAERRQQEEEERLAKEKEEEEQRAEEMRSLEPRRQEEEQAAEEVKRINALKRLQEITEREESARQGMREPSLQEEEDTNVQAAQMDYIEQQREPRTGMFPWMDVPQARSILDSHPHMYPFEDGEIAECVRIEPNDIGMFPMEAWTLGNNSFIRHAFFNYRHLLFAKKQVRDGCLYLLMVPGVYNPREKHMARMFGFDCFKCVNRKNLRIGEFGYWYLPINFQ